MAEEMIPGRERIDRWLAPTLAQFSYLHWVTECMTEAELRIMVADMLARLPPEERSEVFDLVARRTGQQRFRDGERRRAA